MLGRDFVMVGAAKVGAQQTREITDKEWLQSCGARADYRCIDFRKALLKLLNGIPCVVCRGHQRFQEGGSTNCDGTNTAKKVSRQTLKASGIVQATRSEDSADTDIRSSRHLQS